MEAPSPVTVSGRSGPARGNPIRGDFLLAVKGTRVFSVGAVAAGDAFDQFEADFGRIIDSFEITLEPPTEAISTTAKSQDVMEAIGHRVALIRSLPALPETNGRFLAREDFNARVEVLDEEMRRDAVRLKGLCLILDLVLAGARPGGGPTGSA